MQNERNYGIDLLRMFSMFLVVLLHVLGCGGILDAAEAGSLQSAFAWGLEAVAFCAVNCYALISGYVMWNRRGSVGKLLSLWLAVLFWSVVGTVVVVLTCDVSGTEPLAVWSRAFFPVTNNQYWYISAYFLLYLLQPLFSLALERLSKSGLTAVVCGTFLLVSCGTFISGVDAFGMGGGYTPIWLCLCFLWGGYLAKYRLLDRTKAWHGALLYLVCVGVTVSAVLLERVTNGAFSRWKLYNYTSPFMVLAALGLLICFSRLTLSREVRRVVTVLSPAALGVYLIHTHQLVFSYLLAGCAEHFAAYSAPMLIFTTIGAALAIYLFCTALELGRIYLFRLLRVPALCKWVDAKLAALVAKMEATDAEDTVN